MTAVKTVGYSIPKWLTFCDVKMLKIDEFIWCYL